MTRRWTLLAGAIALSLSVPQAAFATSQPTGRPMAQPAAPAPGPDAAAADALAELRDDAQGGVRVQRDAEGAVALVSSTDGEAMVETDATSPRAAAQEQLAAYGDAFGIDGDTSRAVVTQTVDSATGGSVVRTEQVIDGVPVFGGQVVLSLDEDQGLVSVGSATTDAVQVPAPRVSEQQARESALRFAARTHGVATKDLDVEAVGRRLFDPALAQSTDPRGVRPVWQFLVANGADVRETVLIGTESGEIALHFNEAPGINRRICNNNNVRSVPETQSVPVCSTASAARVEGGGTSAVLDVNQAYANLGATSTVYDDLADIDLTETIGTGGAGNRVLVSTVRWCFQNTPNQPTIPCPFPNAFWDGTQMVFGAGYAAADDVVAHELTHGYVERTANLFYLHQSGAINESLADTVGEVVDHRNPASSANDDEWLVGEDLPGGDAVRSMKDPTLDEQPDQMSDYVSAEYWDDNGAVHLNGGIGNKTAYLISQGGTFNGQTVTGIDVGDAGLAKTGLLYLEAIPRLTSGSEYADLGRVLAATCDQLAGDGTAGFATEDCDAVRTAVLATELASQPDDPTAGAPEAEISCPSGADVTTVLARDDDGFDDFEFSSTSGLWGRADGQVIPSNASSGTESLFGLDPDPSLGDPVSGSVTSEPFTVPTTAGGTRLNFHHAYVFDYDDTAFYDGGQVVVQRLVNGAWQNVSGLPWENGAARHIKGSTPAGFTGFGGDSHGYGSSEVDLSSLAGQRVRISFRVEGDSFAWFIGWWIDDVRLYACDTATVPEPGPVSPSAPTTAAVKAATTSAVVSWQPPADRGSSPIASYRITRSDGKVNTAAAGARSLTLTGLRANTAVNVSVAAVNQDGLVGTARTVPLYGSAVAVTSSVAKAVKNRAFTVTGKVTRRGTTTVVSGMPVTLQRRVVGTSVWRAVSSGSTNAKGIKAWSVNQAKGTYYRVVAKGVGSYLGTTSAARTVGMR